MLTPLGISVLALLNEAPMHPYEMYQLLKKRRNDRLVKVRPGSLYHTVVRLAGQQLVTATGTERAGNRPERTTYAITPAGKQALGSASSRRSASSPTGPTRGSWPGSGWSASRHRWSGSAG